MDYFSASDVLNLNEIGFKIAFGVADFRTGEVLDDPDWVRWEVIMQVGFN